ncbi:hypothetical protein [Wolbachia endosymbiont of Litomosoides brasiliensis]|uniref:hypothetical protein n=1 Tax=Wolbachia endosymbiont of Litomosoides brasiliensis TaxID=1812117 RepID=UPI001FEC0100|nr:hypothetical protein [Wolbachia endosymbiont of Litomosoides brasiliensis]
MGHQTKIIDPETLEESPITVPAWIKQQARWIKDYMQTYIVRFKNMKLLYKYTVLKGILLSNFIVSSAALDLLLLSFYCFH